MTDALRECADGFIRTAADNLIDAWDSGASATGEDLIKNKLEQAAAERAAQIASAIQEAARERRERACESGHGARNREQA